MNKSVKSENNCEKEKSKLLTQIRKTENQLSAYDINFKLSDFFNNNLKNVYLLYEQYILNRLKKNIYELGYKTKIIYTSDSNRSNRNTISTKNKTNSETRVTDIAWASDSNAMENKFVACNDSGYLYVYSYSYGHYHDTPKIKISLGDAMLNACAIEQSENRIIATGGFDGIIRICTINLDIFNDKLTHIRNNDSNVNNDIKKFSGHLGGISNLRFLNQSYLLSASFDSMINLWDNNSNGKIVCSYREHTSEVSGIDVSEVNGNIFASGSGDTTVKLWDIRQKKACIASFQGCDSSINCVKFLPGRITTVAAGSEDSTIRIFDYRSYREIGCYKSQKSNSINSIFFNKSGSFLFATVAEQDEILVWDLFSTHPYNQTTTIKGIINTQKQYNENKSNFGYNRGTINSIGDKIAVIQGYQINVFNLKK